MCLATISSVVGIFKDVAIAIGAVVASVVAYFGLKSWRRELRGKADFTAAQELVRATYRLREAMATCRAPWFDISEFPPGYEGKSQSWSEEAKAYAHVFQTRWSPVHQAVAPFDIATSDAEVLWGPSIREKSNELK